MLQSGIHDVMHFLGTSKLEWACLLTDVQRAIRKYYNPTMMLTFDCASPFLATANGQIYIQNETPDRGKWTYRMVPSVDELKYASDTRGFRDAVLADGIFKNFEDSPLTDGLLVNDVCTYAVGDTNKIGTIKVLKGEVDLDKEGQSFARRRLVTQLYVAETQQAGIALVMLFRWVITYGVILTLYKKLIDSMTLVLYLRCLYKSKFDRVLFRDVMEEIFSKTTKEESLAIIEKYYKVLDGYSRHTWRYWKEDCKCSYTL